MRRPSVAELKAKMAERDYAYQQARKLSEEFHGMVEDSGLSVSELSRRLGVTRGTIYSWKKRNQQPE